MGDTEADVKEMGSVKGSSRKGPEEEDIKEGDRVKRSSGWHMVNDVLVPQLLREPVQATYLQLTVCGCKGSGSQCSTRHCLCRKRAMYCSGACGCARAAWCKNTFDTEEANTHTGSQ